MDSGKFKGFIALGCVIKGETGHYYAVCKGRNVPGIQTISIQHKIPIMFGVLMCRVKTSSYQIGRDLKMNKGYECAISLFEDLFKSPYNDRDATHFETVEKYQGKTRYAARGSMCRLIAEALRTIQESANFAYHKISRLRRVRK